MKNIFKSRFSLIAICILLGILICSFTLCGCRTNYGLLEGMDPSQEGGTEEEQSGGSIPTVPTVGGIAGSLASIGSQVKERKNNDILSESLGTALETAIPLSGALSGAGAGTASSDSLVSTTKENFQVSKPLGWKSMEDNEGDDANLSKWVSDAVKYSKGMGTEDRLNSFQYNSGPPIPLPEGQLFFFKDTKFNPSCCPSTYTSSIGCACMSKKQFQYLTQRGGNHTAPNNRTSYFNEF